MVDILISGIFSLIMEEQVGIFPFKDVEDSFLHLRRCLFRECDAEDFFYLRAVKKKAYIPPCQLFCFAGAGRRRDDYAFLGVKVAVHVCPQNNTGEIFACNAIQVKGYLQHFKIWWYSQIRRMNGTRLEKF